MAAAQAADYTAVVFSLTSRPQSDGWRQQTAGRPLLHFSSAAATLHAAPALNLAPRKGACAIRGALAPPCSSCLGFEIPTWQRQRSVFSSLTWNGFKSQASALEPQPPVRRRACADRCRPKALSPPCHTHSTSPDRCRAPSLSCGIPANRTSEHGCAGSVRMRERAWVGEV
ncbi:hypothetical protein MHYP_G00066530 [Metynnis hypsauchen]